MSTARLRRTRRGAGTIASNDDWARGGPDGNALSLAQLPFTIVNGSALVAECLPWAVAVISTL